MLPDAAVPVPASLVTLLAVFCPLFTAPSLNGEARGGARA